MEKPGEFSFQAQVTAAVGAAMSLPLSWVAGESRQATLNTSFPIILGCFGTVHPDATVEFIPEKIPGQTKQATVYEVTTEHAWAGVVTIEKGIFKHPRSVVTQIYVYLQKGKIYWLFQLPWLI